MSKKYSEIEKELLDLVDRYFPKIKSQGGNKGRGKVMVIVGIALGELAKKELALNQSRKEVVEEIESYREWLKVTFAYYDSGRLKNAPKKQLILDATDSLIDSLKKGK